MYNLSYADSGSKSAFYYIDEQRGFKEFEHKDDAEHARETQLTLARYNLAPKVLSEVGRIRLPENNVYDEKFSGWGYITETAEVLGCGGNECACGECEDLYDRMISRIDKLSSKIEDIGYSFVDNHIGNVGYVRRRGRKVLVCIDTGYESVFDDGGDYDGGCSCYACQQHRESN